MKLTKLDIEILRSMNYNNKDIQQIIEVAKGNNTTYEYNNQKIPAQKAIDLVGRKTYLSALTRSAFHWSATATNENKTVYFDSSNFFKT